jgi:hypothetical protein
MPLLLPATRIGQSSGAPRTERATWSEQADRSGLVAQSTQSVVTNLVAPEVIQAAGVSRPLAPAQAFEWRLGAADETLTHLQAVRELRLLLLAQFVGLIDQVSYRLNQSRLLPKVLRADTELEELVLWVPKTKNEALASVLAGSLAPAYPLFPSAAIQLNPGRSALSKWLVDNSKGQLLAAGDDVQFTDAAQARRFQDSLLDLLQQSAKITPESPWYQSLQRLAGPAIERVPHLPVAHKGLIPPDAAHDHWTCEQCERLGTSWVEAFAGVTTVIEADSQGIPCAKHPDTPLMVGTRPVTFSDLGAARSVIHEHGVPVAKLYIWSDVDLGLRFVRKSSTPSSMQLWYWQSGGPLLDLRGQTITLADAETASSPVPKGESKFSHTLPIASQYLHLVDEKTTHWREAEGCWEMWLKGRPTCVLSKPPTDPPAASDGVVVWPRDEVQGAGNTVWRRQVVGAFSKFSDMAALVTSRAVASKSAEAFEVGPFEPLPYIAAAPEGTKVQYLVLASKGPHGLIERGAVPMRRHIGPIVQGSLMAWVALDFGTANTTVMYGLETPTEPVPVTDGVTKPADACFFPVHGSAFDRAMEDTLSLFSGWYAPEGGPKPMLGTLLFKDSTRHAVVPANLVKNIAPEAKGKVLGNLKWQGLRTYDGSSVQAYLERVLLPAFHAIVASGGSRYRFVATYPLAFDMERKLRFENALTKVLKTIDDSTQLTRLEIQLISESHAGTHAVAALQAPYSLTMDMGGGTTDFALIKRNATAAPTVLLAESLRIGGRDLIRAALRDQKDVQQRVARACGASGETLSVSPEVAIEGLLGSKDVEVRLLTGQPSVNRRQRIAALLSGIVVATVRLVLAALSRDEKRETPPSINVVLLGQGWHLLHGELLPQPFTESFFLEALQKRATSINFQQVAASASSTERKLQLVRGALRLAANAAVDDTSSAMSFMGLDLALSDGAQVQISTPLGAVPTVTYADGDPGISTLIDDLVATMRFFDSDRATIGDVDARLAETEQRMPVRDRLVRGGNRDLLACQENAQIVRSPLMAIIEETWLQFWSPRGE